MAQVCIIGAWNFPIQLVLNPLVAAVAAGNAAVIKPSEVSTRCAALLEQLLPRYVDPEAVRIVQGAVAETTELLRQRFDHILYTGACRGGQGGGGRGMGMCVARGVQATARSARW